MIELYKKLRFLFFKFRSIANNRIFYAVTDGSHKGSFVLFFDYDNKNKEYGGLMLCAGLAEDNVKRYIISKKDVLEGIKLGILDPVEIMNKNMYNFLYTEYKAQKTN